MYNIKSPHATEFIDNDEVLETLKYADENKNNIELIDKILKKAKLGNGLTHKEASVLLACEIEEKTKKFMLLQKKLSRIITETELFYLHLCICQITA